MQTENILEELQNIRLILTERVITQKEVLSLQEASKYLDLSVSQLYKLTASRKVPHSSPGGKKVYFKRSELDDWALSGKRASTKEIDDLANDYLISVFKNKGGRNG